MNRPVKFESGRSQDLYTPMQDAALVNHLRENSFNVDTSNYDGFVR